MGSSKEASIDYLRSVVEDNLSVLSLSSDSEFEALKKKSPKKAHIGDEGATKTNVNTHVIEENDDDMEVAEEETTDKPVGHNISSPKLPLVIYENVKRSKVLVECVGESPDLSCGMGSVGRIVISDNPPNPPDMFLDLEAKLYKTTRVPSATFCVVNVGPSEVKINAIMNDFIQLEPHPNSYEADNRKGRKNAEKASGSAKRKGKAAAEKSPE